MEKGIFLGDVGATKSRGTAHVEEEEEVRGELGGGRHSDQKCRTKTGNHLTAALLLTSSGSGPGGTSRHTFLQKVRCNGIKTDTSP